MMNFQNSTLIENKGLGLDSIDLFYNLGIRIIQLTYNLRTLAGNGCMERNDSGLSIFGLKIIERMNKLGMLIDVSHCGVQTTLDSIEASKDPIAFTHTGCKAIFDHPRSKTDETIQALAKKGGYIGIYAPAYFLGFPAREKGTLKEFLDHIDHAVNIAGVEHVGIGTDLGVRSRSPEQMRELKSEELFKIDFGPSRFWQGWKPEHHVDDRSADNFGIFTDEWANSWVNWPNNTIGLISRGYSDKEIKGIIGENFLKILEKVVG
jgi:membrane dipeptidase